MNIVAKMNEFVRAAEKKGRPALLPEGYSIDIGLNSGRARICEDGVYGRCHYEGLADAACLWWMREWLIAEGVKLSCESSADEVVQQVEFLLRSE